MSEIKCQRCGDDTNYPPDDMPTEYRGYCPSCTVDLIEANLLPKPTPEAMLNYMATAIANRIMGDICGGGVEVHVVKVQPRSPSDIVETPMGPIQYSQN